MSENLYRKHEYQITRDNEGALNQSGSFVYWSDDPVSDFAIGDTFEPIPGVQLKINAIKITDNPVGLKNGKVARQWQVEINSEGSGSSSGGGDGESTNDKFTFEILDDGNGGVTKNGTWQVTRTGPAPSISLAIGDTFTVPGVGEITCTKVSGSDKYSGGERQWTVTFEGSSSVTGSSGAYDKYTFEISRDSDGITTTTATRETTCTGSAPTIETQLGETFNVPYIGAVTCTKVSTSDEFNDSGVRVWTVTYEGASDASGGAGDLPESETEINYELNGITVRSVSGEFLVLRRSTTPVTRKSIMIYTETDDMITTIGGAYAGGLVTNEKVSRETVKKSGVIVKQYYRHDIEVES